MNVRDLPKIELHCHLDGSVRPKTLIELAECDGVELPSKELKVIKEHMSAPLNCKSLLEYLKKFELPLKVMQTKESLKRIAFELLEDAANENIKYIEVRFGPMLHINGALSLEEIIESVLEGIKLAEQQYDIVGNLILSCLRNEDADTVYDVIEAGRAYLAKGVVAIDLCAVEEEGFARKYINHMKKAKDYGYRITIHAGENGFGMNVYNAVKLLGAERIGHGVFINDCKEAFDIVKEENVTLELCPTSNIQTKAVSSIQAHPIMNFLSSGIKVSVNTDNRTVSNTTLVKELVLIERALGLNYSEYKQIYFDSVDSAFATLEVKERLKNKWNESNI